MASLPLEVVLPVARMRVAVIGLGYIGLPTAALVARAGAEVLGVDISQRIVDTVSSGAIHIEETDLADVVKAVVSDGSLRASTRVEPADFFVIAVPTPFKGDHAPDVDFVLAAAHSIAPVLKPGDVIILESTSPVGTTEQIRDLLAEARPDLSFPGRTAGDADADIAIAYCPERVLPGNILQELVKNDRCIGGVTPACATRARAFYAPFVDGDCVLTDVRTAEMVKLVENAFRDVNIAFANELSVISDTLRLDVWEVIRLANRHPRVNILQPGPGVGGHCIAVDPWFIVHSDPANARLISTARQVNDDKVRFTVDRAAALIDDVGDAPVACLGLAFKADIDDLRESPAMQVTLELARRYGSRIRVVEPYVAALPAAFAGTGATLVSLEQAMATCPAAVLLVDHAVFKAMDPARRAHLRCYDTRGIWLRSRAASGR
jgi:UDP-N-acetyl-D-mannosaminuronic acid dehydrogenase